MRSFIILSLLLFSFLINGVSPVAACRPDGGAIIGTLPGELAEIVEGALTDDGVCVAPAPEKTTAQKQQRPLKTNLYKGPVVAIQGAHIEDEVVVSIKGGQSALETVAGDYGLEVRSSRLMAIAGGLIVRFGIPDGRPVALVRASLAQDPLVLEAVPNHIYELNDDHSSARSNLPERYALKSSGLLKAHELSRGRDVKVAIIDSGVDVNHPSLDGAIARVFDGLPKIPLRNTKHGTAVALLVGGAGNRFLGAAPEASLFVARAFDHNQSGKPIGSVYAVISSLNWAHEQDVDIINMSFSGPQNKLLSRSLSFLLQSNVVLIAAAGNQGAKAPFAYPAAQRGVIAVTAIDAKNRIYSRANQGSYVFLAAPGVDLMLPSLEDFKTTGDETEQKVGISDEISFKSGTSYGAALVSGIAALVLEGRKDMDLLTFQRLLIESVKDLGRPGRDKVYGYGLVQAETLIKRAQE